MTKEQAIAHFGSVTAVAKALGIAQPSVSEWVEIPPLRQLELERITKGALRADRQCDRFRVPA